MSSRPLSGNRMSARTHLPATSRRYSRLWLCLSAVIGSLVLAELGLHAFFPQFHLPDQQARFSPRYHHTSPEFSALLKNIQGNPAAFKEGITVAILGDSFVAGNEVDYSQRFT